MKKGIFFTVIISCILLSVFTLTGCGKKKCAKCGKTEDEVQLYLFDKENHPGGDDKYYCSICYRIVFSETPDPIAAEAIENALKSDTVESST